MREDAGEGDGIGREEGATKEVLLDLIGDGRGREVTPLVEAMDEEEDSDGISSDRRSAIRDVLLPILLDQLCLYMARSNCTSMGLFVWLRPFRYLKGHGFNVLLSLFQRSMRCG